MSWLENITIKKYTKNAIIFLFQKLEEIELQDPTISGRDALIQIGTPISWDLYGGKPNLNELDDVSLIYRVVLFLTREALMWDMQIYITLPEQIKDILETTEKEFDKIKESQ